METSKNRGKVCVRSPTFTNSMQKKHNPRAMPRKARVRSEDVTLDEDLSFADLQLPVRAASPPSNSRLTTSSHWGPPADFLCKTLLLKTTPPPSSLVSLVVVVAGGAGARAERVGVPRALAGAARGDPPRAAGRGPRGAGQERHGQDGHLRHHPVGGRVGTPGCQIGCHSRVSDWLHGWTYRLSSIACVLPIRPTRVVTPGRPGCVRLDWLTLTWTYWLSSI
jgi:hypothetical protein